ncbi:MAG: hypothetical protein Q8M26_11450, partial [Pseudolabrys sp.]|nr:hypothetical protein [Pseudolabrys sp.]
MGLHTVLGRGVAAGALRATLLASPALPMLGALGLTGAALLIAIPLSISGAQADGGAGGAADNGLVPGGAGAPGFNGDNGTGGTSSNSGGGGGGGGGAGGGSGGAGAGAAPT